MTHAITKTGKVVSTMVSAFEGYLRSNHYGLYDCYNNPSTAKQSAFDYCHRVMMDTPAGRQGQIISYNTFMFTYGFIGRHNGKDAFFYITPNKEWFAYLDELTEKDP